MALTKLTGLGEITSNFLLNDFDVYVMNTSGTGSYVSTDWALLGFTSSEKTVNPERGKFMREAKLPRVVVYKKTIRKKFNVTFGLDNWNPSFTPVFSQATKIVVNGTTTKISHGTDEGATQYAAYRLSTKLEDGTVYSITVPKGEMTQDGELSVGGEENTVIPLNLEAVYNPLANATGSLYYELYQTAGVSATLDTPPGYV